MERENLSSYGNERFEKTLTRVANFSFFNNEHFYKNISFRQYQVLLLMPNTHERQSLQDFLTQEGNKVTFFDKIIDCDKWCQANDFDILIIDINSIDDPTLIWFRNSIKLRDKGVIVLSTIQDPLFRLMARKAGADNFLSKPILHEEVLSVIDNLMFKIRKKDSEAWKIMTKKWLLICPNNKIIKMTFTEKILLEHLAIKAGQVISKDEIAEVLGYSPSVYDFRRLEIIIRRLRNKVQSQSGLRLPLDTAHRKGYSLTADFELVTTA